ncbi:hypothetical protein D3A96_09890 [Robertkochia marina]|nr:hypothetical protein D3A96_09890 [Robertkochia marina]
MDFKVGKSENTMQDADWRIVRLLQGTKVRRYGGTQAGSTKHFFETKLFPSFPRRGARRAGWFLVFARWPIWANVAICQMF